VTHETPLALTRRARRINRALAEIYPDAHCELDFANPLELAVATILSAQCTDVRVNQTTPELFATYKTAADYASADRAELEAIIRPTGFYRNKAASIIGLGQALCDKYGGELPRRLEDLVKLPGIGRKTERDPRQRVRRAGDHRGHALRTAGSAVRLDQGDRPGEGRAPCRRAVPAAGVDDALAPDDLPWAPGLPCATTGVWRVPYRGFMPLLRHWGNGSG
jgi:hypothetical protein